jgi:non-canonical purine NTP pyrophosphatase (RdgB/HAM1 family)
VRQVEILFITSNSLKFGIASRILDNYGVRSKQQNFEFAEPQTLDIQTVAIDKANQGFKNFKEPFIVDDSGFRITALNGFPGALLKNVLQTIGDEGLCRTLRPNDSREAQLVNVTIYGDPATKNTEMFETVLKGTISDAARGSRKTGIGVDRIFIPEGYTKTLAELNDAEWETYDKFLELNLNYNRLGAWLKAKDRKS